MRHIRLLHPVRRFQQQAFAMYMSMPIRTGGQGVRHPRQIPLRDAVQGKMWSEFRAYTANYAQRLLMDNLFSTANHQGRFNTFGTDAPAMEIIYAATAELSRPFWTIMPVPWVENRGTILPNISTALDELEHSPSDREEEWERLRRAGNWGTKRFSITNPRDRIETRVTFRFAGWEQNLVFRPACKQLEVR